MCVGGGGVFVLFATQNMETFVVLISILYKISIY